MILRAYRPEDLREMVELFYDTVHTVNAGDYTPEQLDAWADGVPDLEQWRRTLSEHTALVAVEGERIVGFGDMAPSGYLDRLYVHKDYQRQGVATAICDSLEQAFPVREVTSHASITARPFFESRGYRVIKEQQVARGGILLTNYVMEKQMLPSAECAVHSV